MITQLDNEREGAEIGLSMPIQFTKFPEIKTITWIQFGYRCHHFGILYQLCKYTFKKASESPNVYKQAPESPNVYKQAPAAYVRARDKKSCNVMRLKAHQNGHKKCVRIRKNHAPKHAPKRTQKSVRIRLGNQDVRFKFII